MRSSKRKALMLATAVVASLSQAQSGSAASHTWTGATDNNWNTATNWTSNAVPTANTEDVFFTTPGASNLSIAANTGTFSVRTLTFNANTAATPVVINVDSAHTFTIQGTTGDDVTVLAGSHKFQGANA